MTRPAHLADYGNPPVQEVVVGVQFAPPPGYSQIYAGQVWDLYRDRYPEVEEHPILAPVFETFGPRNQVAQAQIEFVQGATHDRFWFLSPDRTELIQFQNTRLLHNWRALGSKGIYYPRFEYMMEWFEKELRQLADFMKSLTGTDLEINQYEVTYINQIRITPDLPKLSDWFNIVGFGDYEPEDLAIRYRHIISDPDGTPLGRLTGELATGVTPHLEQMVAYNLTVRGSPREPTIESALEFLKIGRERIVMAFTETTTKAAHQHWERKT